MKYLCCLLIDARFESVCILGFNSPEWAIACRAAIHAGGLSVGKCWFTTGSPRTQETNRFINFMYMHPCKLTETRLKDSMKIN